MAKEYLQQCLKSGADGFRFDTGFILNLSLKIGTHIIF
ncbi:hypothetical protein [Clostridium butyricum]